MAPPSTPYLPPAGKVWSGMVGGFTPGGINAFARGQGATPPVVEFFATWGPTTAVSYLDGLSTVTEHAGARPAFALSMTDTNGHESINAQAVALGHGDRALLVGTQVLSKYTSYSRLDRFYANLKRYHKPFTLAEWGIFQSGDDPGYVTGLFNWVRSHAPVRLMIYGQRLAGSPSRLQGLPGTEQQLQAELRTRPFR